VTLLHRVVETSVNVLSEPSPPTALADIVAALTELGVVHSAAGAPDRAQALDEGAQFVGSIQPGVAMVGFLNPLLAGPTPAAVHTPVRDLTKTAALLEAVDHAAKGRITLTPGATTRPDGTVQLPDQNGVFTIGPVVAGVTYKFTKFGDKRRSNYKPVAADLIRLDIRHVVGLVRLAMHLSTSSFGVTEIHHVGIGGDTVRTDCHGKGRAIDFVGVAGVAANIAYTLTVFNDWKNHSVPNLDDRTKPRRPNWPPVTRPLEFRLLTEPNVDGFARNFFTDLYSWVASEYQDRTSGPFQVEPPSSIGLGSRIMTPDHPDSKPGTPNGREAHGAHMHWQVGPT
jgi:hypothetical protein